MAGIEQEEKSMDDRRSTTSSSASSESAESIHPWDGRRRSHSRSRSRSLSRVRTSKSSAFSSPRTEPILARLRSRPPQAPFSHPLTREKTKADVIVEFEGPDDPYNPKNWPMRKKAITTALYGFTTMGATFASSVYSPAVNPIAIEFGVSTEVSILGIALLLFGFGLGPLLWAPLSEVYGRKPAVLIPYFIAACFSFGTAAAKDIQTVLITRFFTGFFGSAPVTNSGGVLGDIFSAEHRGIAIVAYAMAIVAGPTIGPLIGSACTTSYLGWRWTEYVTGILLVFILVLDVVILDESFPPVLLQTKARRLRHSSGNWALHARHEEWDVSLSELAHKYLVVPFKLLMTPICLLIALYASFTYAILYASLAAFPIVFEDIRGWSPVVGSLAFLALLLGILIAACLNLLNQRYYIRKFHENNNRPVPEARLPPMMVGSVFFAAGLFIFAWTGGDPQIFWIAPMIGAVCLGLGFFTIFQSALNYLIDTFQKNAASAVAANTFLRSCFAGAFPIFIGPLIRAIGVGWGVSIWGFCAAALIPVPYIFFVKGKAIRASSEWSKDSV